MLANKLRSSAAISAGDPDLVLVFNTSLGSLTIALPLTSATIVDVTVDWGDGTSDVYTTGGTKNHTYATGGIYTVRISGTLNGFGGINGPELTKCLSFGTTGLVNLSGAFRNASNLTEVPLVLPSTVTNTSLMFFGATSFNQDISSWNTSSLTNMSIMFSGATSFNQNLTNWCVGNFQAEPTNFATSSALIAGNKPVWGTCPGYVVDGSITYIGQATGITSATLPAHQAGDLILAFAFRDGTAVLPTEPSGWTNIDNAAANLCAARVSYKVATSSSEVTDTWSGATTVIFLIYRGVNITSLTIIDTKLAQATSTITYRANGFWQGLSRVVAFAGHRSTNTALGTAPSGLTLIINPTDTTDEAAAFQSTVDNYGNWPNTNVAVGGTASGWITFTLRLRVPITPAP